MKVIVIIGGGDWADASCEHLSVPADMDLAAEKATWVRLYRTERDDSAKPWKSFPEWLRTERGAKDADLETEEDL